MKSNKIVIESHKNDYGCVMVSFDFPEIKQLHRVINPNHIYIDPNDDDYGLETNPHVTLLYGLHDVITTEDIKQVFTNVFFGKCRISNPSVFEMGQYDVLKYDVMGDGLVEANTQLRRFPYTNEFTDYHPHLTIGYLKPGYGNQYAKSLKGSQYILTPTQGIYSKMDGSKEVFNIIVK